jgi:plastocyanin
MRTALTASLACCGALLVAGCGSSGSSSTASSATTAAQSTPSTTPTSSVKVTTTPKFAAPPASAPAKSGVVQITYRNVAINPDTVKVKVGSTIKWTNADPIEHNVTSMGGPQKFVSKNFGEGATFAIKAEKPGIVHYECTLHPASMNGTIQIVK